MNKIRLRSATFHQAVRLPGSSSTANYIPSSDYPLTLYPDIGILEAKLKPGINAQQNQEPRRWYHVSNMKDSDPFESDLPPETAVTTDSNGVLAMPNVQMVSKSDGSFERVVDVMSAAAPLTSEPEKKRTRGPNKPKAAPAAAPAAPPVTIAHPRNRAGAGTAAGGA